MQLIFLFFSSSHPTHSFHYSNSYHRPSLAGCQNNFSCTETCLLNLFTVQAGISLHEATPLTRANVRQNCMTSLYRRLYHSLHHVYAPVTSTATLVIHWFPGEFMSSLLIINYHDWSWNVVNQSPFLIMMLDHQMPSSPWRWSLMTTNHNLPPISQCGGCLQATLSSRTKNGKNKKK